MSYLAICACGQRWRSDGEAAATCPACGRAVVPIAVGGWRALWPRLLLASTVTLFAVIVVGVVLARLLPARHRATAGEPAAQATNPEPRLQEQPPFPPAREKASSPPVPPASTARATVPFPDRPAPIAPILEAPPRRAPPARPKAPPDKTVPELEGIDVFYQHVVISRLSQYHIADLDLGQNVQYELVSRLRVKEKKEGSLVVEQKVESVRLGNADPALQKRLEELLQKTKGATFTMTLNERREVKTFEGSREAIQVLTGKNPLGGPSFLLWSFLDQDGWKELAQLSFFQPPSGKNTGRWSRDMTHSWGPLGQWSGKIHYRAAGKQTGGERFHYLLDLAYQPPQKGGELPFEIGTSQFQIQTASGAILYQPSRGRVAAAEERFHVRGLLAVSVLGVEAPVQMDEMQVFQLRILDHNPLAR
jgi:hypothetical protein